MQPPQRPQSERGAALLVVLLLSMILVPFASEFAFQIQLEAKTAQNVIDQLAIDNALLGQYEIVLARLRYDGPGNETDSYDDAWNDRLTGSSRSVSACPVVGTSSLTVSKLKSSNQLCPLPAWRKPNAMAPLSGGTSRTIS